MSKRTINEELDSKALADATAAAVAAATAMALMGKDIQYIKEEIVNIQISLQEQFVTKTEFDPIQKIVYGTVALILVTFLTALLFLIIKSH